MRRILRVAVDFGWLDRPHSTPAFRATTCKAAQHHCRPHSKGRCFCKIAINALPLDKRTTKTIAVIGPTATQTVTTGGGSGEVVSFANTNLLVGISNYLGEGAKVLYARGIRSINQMARLTQFTTDAQGATAGVTHTTYAKADLEGGETGTTVEKSILVPPARLAANRKSRN